MNYERISKHSHGPGRREGGGGGGRSEGGGGRALRVKVPPKVNGIVAHKDQRSSKVCNILCVIYLFIIIIINFVFDGWIVSRHLLEAIVLLMRLQCLSKLEITRPESRDLVLL